MLNDYLIFKNQCKSNYQDRLDISECDKLFYSLKKNFSDGYSCETDSNTPSVPKELNEKNLLIDKKNYEDQYYHGSEGQLRCGVYTEQEFRQYISLCPVHDFIDVASAQKCLSKTKYIRERYPKLDCEAKLEWYGALFNIHNVNSSYKKARDYLFLNR